ncbi:MAG: hypothetical protein ACRDEA_23845 [Microcystaceae cyanobacterium]
MESESQFARFGFSMKVDFNREAGCASAWLTVSLRQGRINQQLPNLAFCSVTSGESTSFFFFDAVNWTTIEQCW